MVTLRRLGARVRFAQQASLTAPEASLKTTKGFGMLNNETRLGYRALIELRPLMLDLYP